MSWNLSWVIFKICNTTCITAQEFDNILCDFGIIIIYIHQLHYSILAIICVSGRVTNLEMQSWHFGLG